MTNTFRLLLSLALLCILWIPASADMTEEERVDGYHARNYTWPPPTFVPNTPGWTATMDQRLSQIAHMPNASHRYEAYATVVRSAFLLPNFTELGFGLARAPEELTTALREGIQDGLPNVRLEQELSGFYGPQAWFIDRPDLNQRVLHELKHYAETWCQMPLVANNAYGFRLYRNSSQLMMHVDIAQTHVISFIYHVAAALDAEPWPLMIEDYWGRTHAVILTPGDILFYESAKVAHGRPTKFNGSWYTSIFAHYYPAGDWAATDHIKESVFAIPPSWSVDPDPAETSPHPRMAMRGTSYSEPDCPNYWCRSTDTINWSGPGKHGVWFDPLFREHPFQPQAVTSHTEL
jgi:hypothetical protein